MSLAKTITMVMGGTWCGSYGTIPTPGHSLRDRGTMVRDKSNHPDDVVIACFNDDWRAVRDELRARGLLPAWTGRRDPAPARRDIAREHLHEAERRHDKERTAWALRL